jgi:hypothetical protein
MKVLNLTPECFVEVFLLCFYWEHGGFTEYETRNGSMVCRRSHTTVDHVLKILGSAGFLTSSQIKMVRDKRAGLLHQRAFARFCGTTYVVNDRLWIVARYRISPGAAIPLAKLIRNIQIELTDTGIERINGLEKKYAEYISKEAYIAEAKRIDQLFTDVASASASTLYRKRIEAELKE